MLNFLRKIRKSLIDTGSTRKYLLYAFGEIALVVIGILIALQINNWNEKQKAIRLGDTYLSRIADDLKLDTTILNQNILLADKLKDEYLLYIQGMHDVQHTQKEFVQLVSSINYNVDELILTDIAYNEMVNTGKLDLLRSAQLKKNITNYYRQYQFVASRVAELNSSNLDAIAAASEIAPNLKYSLQGYLSIVPNDMFKDKNNMYRKSDWAFINTPESLAFRLHEDAVYYYYMKQVLLKPMYTDLVQKAQNLLIQLESDLK